MKNASKTMYRIGRLFNFIFLGLGALLFVLGLIIIIAADDAEGKATGTSCLSIGVFYLVTAIIALILSGKALRAIGDGKENRKPHIIMIVIGAISSDIFYLLGGIFGIIAESQDH